MERVVLFGWQKSADRHAGQALGEYGLALGLLAVVALSALMFLGGSIRDLLAHAADASSQSPGQTLSLNGSTTSQGGLQGTGNGSTGGSGTSGLNTAQGIPPNVTLQIDPQTGQLQISGSSDSGSNATSIDGGKLISALASQLKALADFKTSDGKPLPSDIQDLLKQLSRSGNGIAQFSQDFAANQSAILQLQATINAQNSQGQFSGPPYYDPKLVASTVQYSDSYIQFANAYQQLEPKLAALAQQDPDFAAVQKKTADYAGALSVVADKKVGEGFMDNISFNRIPTEALNTSLSQSPDATPYFQALSSAMKNMSPAEKDVYFKTALDDVGNNLLVGTSIATGSPLNLSLP